MDPVKYEELYDIVNTNKKQTGESLAFTKEQFIAEVGKPPIELKGIKGTIIYILIRIARLKKVQLIIQKMPEGILNLGRKLVG